MGKQGVTPATTESCRVNWPFCTERFRISLGSAGGRQIAAFRVKVGFEEYLEMGWWNGWAESRSSQCETVARGLGRDAEASRWGWF